MLFIFESLLVFFLLKLILKSYDFDISQSIILELIPPCNC
jgi:hypothetical protein